MIKIPKSLDELKQLVTENNVSGLLNKVKDSLVSEQPAAPGATDSTYPDIIAQLKKSMKEQTKCVQNLQEYIETLHQQLAALQEKLKPEPTAVELDETITEKAEK